MSREHSPTTEPTVRFHKRVRFIRPDYYGITIGGVEHVMQRWEAVMLASMIDEVVEAGAGDITNG